MANPEIIVELGRRFKEYRLTYRLTQKEAAEKAGVSLITLRPVSYTHLEQFYYINSVLFLFIIMCTLAYLKTRVNLTTTFSIILIAIHLSLIHI